MKSKLLATLVVSFYSVISLAQVDPEKIGVKMSDNSRVKLSFVGAGDIQKSLNEGSDIAANTGIGALYHKWWPRENRLFQDFQLEIVINIASTSDSISATYTNAGVSNVRDFGTYLLLPMNSGQATLFKSRAYIGNPPGCLWKVFTLWNAISGIYANFIGSNQVWSDSSTSMNATGIMGKLGVFHEFVQDELRLNQGFSITLGVAATYRGVYGDTGFKGEHSRSFRSGILSTEKRHFWGWSFDLGLRLNNIEAAVSVPRLISNGDDIEGLTSTQFITSIRFIGGFPISLKH